ncbi:hypothetical protein GCM10027047_05970 [Rhodococcus aerolatus]
MVLLGALSACGSGATGVGASAPSTTAAAVQGATRGPSASTGIPDAAEDGGRGAADTVAPTSVVDPGASSSSAVDGRENSSTATSVVATNADGGALPPAPPPGTTGGGDDQFLANLAAVGGVTPGPAAAIALGRSACDRLAGGSPLTAVVETVSRAVGSDRLAAGAVVGAAVVSFCPQLGRAQGG